MTTYSEQMEAAKSFGDIVKKGDLLMANLHLCEKNASSVEVGDLGFVTFSGRQGRSNLTRACL